jgi:preprotein translocase subunit SecF
MVGGCDVQLIGKILFILSVVFIPTHAMAYVGPGLGAGTVGVVMGIIGSIFIALFAVLWYPFKRLLKNFKKSDRPACGNSRQSV